MIIALIAPIVFFGGLTVGSTVGTGPTPPSWTHERVLECDEGTRARQGQGHESAKSCSEPWWACYLVA